VKRYLIFSGDCICRYQLLPNSSVNEDFRTDEKLLCPACLNAFLKIENYHEKWKYSFVPCPNKATVITGNVRKSQVM